MKKKSNPRDRMFIFPLNKAETEKRLDTMARFYGLFHPLNKKPVRSKAALLGINRFHDEIFLKESKKIK